MSAVDTPTSFAWGARCEDCMIGLRVQAVSVRGTIPSPADYDATKEAIWWCPFCGAALDWVGARDRGGVGGAS